MSLTSTEENYIKTIFILSIQADISVTTNDIASIMNTTAASVTDMLKKLAQKELITYQPYKGARLSEKGYKHATSIIRKNRLWNVFLYQSLNIPWEAVREIAEELEHIKSDLLLDHLDAFLGFPKFDPHGDPIPNAQGKYTLRAQSPLSGLQPGKSGLIIGVKNPDNSFLKYLSEKGIEIGKSITAFSLNSYDHSMTFHMDRKEIILSGNAAQLILIKPL